MAFKEKLLSSLPPVEAGGRHYKRYYVTPAVAGLTPEVEKAALGMLPGLLPEPDGTPPAGFIVLHLGGDGAAYLNAYTWVWDNVLHMRGAAAAQAAAGAGAAAQADPTEKLSRLADLHDRGVLSDDEFAAQKAKVLDG